MFVMAIVAVIGIGVGVLAATIGSSQPRTYAVEGLFRAVGGPPLGPDYVRLTGTIRFGSTSSPGTVYYTHAVDGRWTARLPPGTYNVSGRSNDVESDSHIYWTFFTQVTVATAAVRNVYVAYQIA